MPAIDALLMNLNNRIGIEGKGMILASFSGITRVHFRLEIPGKF